MNQQEGVESILTPDIMRDVPGNYHRQLNEAADAAILFEPYSLIYKFFFIFFGYRIGIGSTLIKQAVDDAT